MDEADEFSEPGFDSTVPPVQALCFFDSTRQLRGGVEEYRDDFQAAFGDSESVPELRALSWHPEHVGARIAIDSGLEVSFCLYPVIDGQARYDLAEAGSCSLFQLYDDGYGSVDPGQLRTLLDWLLEDILPAVGHYDAAVLEERFGGGGRPLLLCDTSGRVLQQPPATMTGD